MEGTVLIVIPRFLVVFRFGVFMWGLEADAWSTRVIGRPAFLWPYQSTRECLINTIVLLLFGICLRDVGLLLNTVL